MAQDFTLPPSIGSDFHGLRAPVIPSFLDIDPNVDHFHFTDQLNPTSATTVPDSSSLILPSTLNFPNHSMGFMEFPGSLADTFPGVMFHPGDPVLGFIPGTVPTMGNELCESRKRKAPDGYSESNTRVSSWSPTASRSKRKSVRPPF